MRLSRRDHRARGHELLDTQPWWHDPEKRCMQLEYIVLSAPAWDLRPEQRVNMFDRKYTLVSSNKGAVRACVTLASFIHSAISSMSCCFSRIDSSI